MQEADSYRLVTTLSVDKLGTAVDKKVVVEDIINSSRATNVAAIHHNNKGQAKLRLDLVVDSEPLHLPKMDYL
jgi:hypothetical protein